MLKGTPTRIVCLTEETTEWLYLLGEERRIVGISAYTCRPEKAKTENPVVSAFTGGSVEKIKALKPDLIIGFSDVQANLAAELIRENLNVLITNQRSIQEILDTMHLVGRLVGAKKKAAFLVDGYRAHLQTVQKERASYPRPKVYFEEWDEPMVSAIQWVGELIEIAGGENIFSDRAKGKSSKERVVSLNEIIQRSPEIFIGCWCGKSLDKDSVCNRPGFSSLPAIVDGNIQEIDPSIILQPGPACLTAGLDALCRII